MSARLSPDSQAIALVCSRLGPLEGAAKPLTPTEWHELSLSLRRSDPALRPGQLLGFDAAQLRERLDLSEHTLRRLAGLLARGGQLAFEVEHLSSRGIWLLTRADGDYPKQLKDRLGATTPPILYCSGPRGLLAAVSLAVVGSRDVDNAGLDYARSLGARCARDQITVVSGAARGVDWTAMTGALQAGGTAVGVLADPLERMIKRQDLRRALADEQLLLITSFHPSARWHAGNAMRRNRLIYAMASAAVVVATAEGSGGTWTGAVENLRHRWVPLYVRNDDGRGAHGLAKHGAVPLPDASPPEQIRDLFVPAQESLLDLQARSETTTDADQPADLEASRSSDYSVLRAEDGRHLVAETKSKCDGGTPADLFFAVVWEALADYLVEPRRAEDVAETFDIALTQARAWLLRAVAEGRAVKKTRPVRYVVIC